MRYIVNIYADNIIRPDPINCDTLSIYKCCELSVDLGISYLQCLQENFKESHEHRSHICGNKFISFDNCRKDLVQHQEEAIKKSIEKQDMMDSRARNLFNIRMQLLHRT